MAEEKDKKNPLDISLPQAEEPSFLSNLTSGLQSFDLSRRAASGDSSAIAALQERQANRQKAAQDQSFLEALVQTPAIQAFGQAQPDVFSAAAAKGPEALAKASDRFGRQEDRRFRLEERKQKENLKITTIQGTADLLKSGRVTKAQAKNMNDRVRAGGGLAVAKEQQDLNRGINTSDAQRIQNSFIDIQSRLKPDKDGKLPEVDLKDLRTLSGLKEADFDAAMKQLGISSGASVTDAPGFDVFGARDTVNIPRPQVRPLTRDEQKELNKKNRGR